MPKARSGNKSKTNRPQVPAKCAGHRLAAAHGVNEPEEIGDLYQRIRAILDESRLQAARSVNSEMVRAYWLIGQAIVEHEQKGKRRADYGERLIESLAERLTAEFGRGFNARRLADEGVLSRVPNSVRTADRIIVDALLPVADGRQP